MPIDPSTLKQHYDTGRQLGSEPVVWLFEQFAAADEIVALLGAACNRVRPALVSGADSGFISSGRSGGNCWIPHDDNMLTLQLARRISELVGIPLTHAESFQAVHYGPAQEYRPHYDAWDADTERGQRCMQRGGQRLVTALLYLNDVEGGGHTVFPQLGFDVAPQPGSLLLFHNCVTGTNLRHTNSLHGGMPVISGEKWAANLWFREHPFNTRI